MPGSYVSMQKNWNPVDWKGYYLLRTSRCIRDPVDWVIALNGCKGSPRMEFSTTSMASGDAFRCSNDVAALMNPVMWNARGGNHGTQQKQGTDNGF